jgi:hypothetical protein
MKNEIEERFRKVSRETKIENAGAWTVLALMFFSILTYGLVWKEKA